jgi:ATP-binding cassette subfamily F protein uup
VKALSGGERNRLLLARLFTRPSNVLVLDEPTNDLDIETLELLEAQIVEFPGTVLLVSHDRTFLDNAVTSTFAFEGDGQIHEYVGGYEDWLRQRPRRASTDDEEEKAAVRPAPPATSPTRSPAARVAIRKRLTFREQRELEALPSGIAALEAEEAQLAAAMNEPDFFRQSPQDLRTAVARLEEIRAALLQQYERYYELQSRRA